MRQFLAIAGLAVLLSGCGEKGDFEKAINAKISQSKLCYSLQDNDIVFNKGFPIKVNRGGNAVNLLITILICSHSILVTSG